MSDDPMMPIGYRSSRMSQLVDQSGEVDEVLAHHLLVIGNHALGDFRVTCLNDLGDGT